MPAYLSAAEYSRHSCGIHKQVKVATLMYPEIAQAQLCSPEICVQEGAQGECKPRMSQLMITLPEYHHGIFRCFSAPREMQEDMTPI